MSLDLDDLALCTAEDLIHSIMPPVGMGRKTPEAVKRITKALITRALVKATMSKEDLEAELTSAKDEIERLKANAAAHADTVRDLVQALTGKPYAKTGNDDWERVPEKAEGAETAEMAEPEVGKTLHIHWTQGDTVEIGKDGKPPKTMGTWADVDVRFKALEDECKALRAHMRDHSKRLEFLDGLAKIAKTLRATPEWVTE